MNDWELVDDGSWNGLRKWMRSTDDDHGTVQVAYDQVNLQAALDANKHAQNHEQIDRKSEMWHVGSIPPIVILKWRTEHGIDIFNPNHAAGVKRLLNSSEWAYLKRAPIVL